MIYVADVSRHVVDRFSLRDGRHTASLGGPGSQPGRFYYPCGIAIAPEGRIIVSDSFNARLQVLSRNGEPNLILGKPGNRYGDMGKPRHVAVGPDGVIFVADVEFGRVHLFDRRGLLLMLLGDSGHELGVTPSPVGVAIATDLPTAVRSLVPPTFRADYFLFVSNSDAAKPISLFAVGERSAH